MFTYAPLRRYLDSKGRSIKQLTIELKLSTNVAVALNNDKSVKLEHIARICNHLDLSIERVVEVIRDTDA
ncbi:helix-turn-helix domain-containing protein [Sporosarcina sp. ITBMC105]